MIYGILLAAGLGRRVGGPKALLRLGERTFHQRAVEAFEQAGLDVFVVVNPRVQEALKEPGPGERRVINRDPDQAGGMFASVLLGLVAAKDQGATGTILLPVDHPLVTGEDIGAIAEVLRAGAEIAVASHAGRRGHPIGLSRVVMEQIAADSSIRTLREVLQRDPGRVVAVSVGAGALSGVNTKEDLERISESSSSVN